MQNMLGKLKPQNQRDIFKPMLRDFIDPRHELVVLSGQVDWKWIENELSGKYSHTGQPSKPVRLMVGLLLLKQMYNLGDETVMEAWIRDPYMQYFCGESIFQWQQPCDPSDLVHFRNRIGKEGAEKILQLSFGGHKDDIQKADKVIVDTTVQEKNVTFPTDVKMQCKVMEACREIAREHNIELRQSYVRVEQQTLLKLRFGHHPRKIKQAKKARKKIKTICGRLVREIRRKLPDDLLPVYWDQLKRFEQIIKQQRHDKDKIYSVHEPDVWCIAKGKQHKPYEFGSKTSVSMLPGCNVVVGVMSFKGNPYDGDTMQPALEQTERLTEKIFDVAIGDRGYRGRKHIGHWEVVTPGNSYPKNRSKRERLRKLCKSRSAIEPIIGHMKTEHRMGRNYLKGFQGDEINALLAGAALNMKSWIRKIRSFVLFWLRIFLESFQFRNQYVPDIGLNWAS